MINSEKLTISDVCMFIGGSQPPKTYFSDVLKEGYIRFVQTRDFKTDNFITFIPKHLTTKFFEKTDIMIGRYGPPIFQIFRGMEGAYNVALLKAKPKKNILNDYLYYFLLQKSIFEYVDKLSARTGGQTGVDLSSLYKYPINLPPIITQQKIAKVLSNLDAKIELNNKINAELEAMAKTLYDYWFVQFDFPDDNGKPYKTSGGNMVWNGELKKEIPFGWDVLDLSDIANITMGQSPPGESYNEYGNGTVFYQGCTDFGNRFPTIRKFTTSPTRFAKQGDILLSVRAPVGTMNIAKEDCCIGRGLASLNSKDNCIAYLFGVMVNLKQIFDRRNVDGTTFGSITKDDLFSLKVIKPSKEILLKFDKIVNPCFEQQNKLEQENQELASLRDWLLPMLMNGQVSVVAEENNLKMRLVKPVDRSAAVIGTHIVKQLEDSKGMGRTKFQKALHLSQYYCEKELGGLYTRKTAGPHNEILIREIEGKFNNYRHINVSHEIVNGQKHIVYKTTPRTVESENLYKELSDNFKVKMDYLIAILKPLSLKETEAISTLYAVWNNRLIENTEVTTQLLKKDFYDWSDRKKKEFIDTDITNALDIMKTHNIIPNGWGDYIDKED